MNSIIKIEFKNNAEFLKKVNLGGTLKGGVTLLVAWVFDIS